MPLHLKQPAPGASTVEGEPQVPGAQLPLRWTPPSTPVPDSRGKLPDTQASRSLSQSLASSLPGAYSSGGASWILSSKNFRQHQKVTPCLEEVAEPASWKLRVWTANTDEEEEGVWRDRYSGKEVEFAPWPPDRPWNGGFAYNCMMLEVVFRVVTDSSGYFRWSWRRQ